MADLLKKKGDMGKFPDDDWRQILEANGFTPSGAREEVWRKPEANFGVKIDVDPEKGEPYYQLITDDGAGSAKWSDTDSLKKIVNLIQQEQEPEPPQLTPEEIAQEDEKLMKSMGIRLGRARTEQKFAGRAPRFSFTVPMTAAGHVAFQLAKAGMKDFEVVHYKEDDFSVFEFPSEPEMHVAEEIVKAEFADQINARKGYWGQWAPNANPFEVKREQPKQYVSSEHQAAWLAREMGKVAGQWGDRSFDSDSVHDILDKYRTDKSHGFDSPVEDVSGLLSEIHEMEMRDPDSGQDYVGVVVFLLTHGFDVPNPYRARALNIAEILLSDEGYMNEWENPELRRVELENEIEILKGTGKVALMLPEDLKYINQGKPLFDLPEMTKAEEDRMLRYRRKKLIAWLNEMGFLDEHGNGELLAEYDAADWNEKDRLYEEARDMIREERRSQSVYRRKMRG